MACQIGDVLLAASWRPGLPQCGNFFSLSARGWVARAYLTDNKIDVQILESFCFFPGVESELCHEESDFHTIPLFFNNWTGGGPKEMGVVQ